MEKKMEFKSNIVQRMKTVNEERQLLHTLMTNKINMQRTLGKHRKQFFTTNSRIFIYECITSLFDEKRTLLNKNQFEFEVNKRFDPEKHKVKIEDYKIEYDIINKTPITDDIDVIIERLQSVQLAGNIENYIRDISKALYSGNINDSFNIIKTQSMNLHRVQKEGRIINLYEDSDDWFEEVRKRKEHPELYAGIPTGFERFDQKTGGLFPAELTIVFGLSGKGKSTFMKALSCNIRKQGKVVLHCGNEENEFQIRSKYMSADSGEKYKPFKTGKYTEQEYNRLKIFVDNAKGVGAIYIYEFPQQTDTTWIERAYHYLEMKGVHVDVIVIDYLDLMKPIGTAYSENDEQGKITSDLKQLAINCHCPVITATQAGTQSEKQEKKAKPFLTSADVFGTKRKVHSANCLIGIVNQTATIGVGEQGVDRNKHHMVLCVPKNRDGEVFTFRQIMDVTCGKFYEDTDDDNPALANIEKQAIEMIDDTLPPDKARDSIDVKEIQKAQYEHLQNKLNKLSETIKNDSSLENESKQKDDFINEAPDASINKEEISSSSSSEIKNEDDFFNEGPKEEIVSSSSSSIQSSSATEQKDDFINEAPDYSEENKLPLSEILKRKNKK